MAEGAGARSGQLAAQEGAWWLVHGLVGVVSDDAAL